jgi:hypothetical protein
MRQDWATARAEGQRRRIIALLEELADADHKEQCRMCGEYFDRLSSHEPHCEGP